MDKSQKKMPMVLSPILLLEVISKITFAMIGKAVFICLVIEELFVRANNRKLVTEPIIRACLHCPGHNLD